jgi:hypothetical protein
MKVFSFSVSHFAVGGTVQWSVVISQVALGLSGLTVWQKEK